MLQRLSFGIKDTSRDTVISLKQSHILCNYRYSVYGSVVVPRNVIILFITITVQLHRLNCVYERQLFNDVVHYDQSDELQWKFVASTTRLHNGNKSLKRWLCQIEECIKHI